MPFRKCILKVDIDNLTINFVLIGHEISPISSKFKHDINDDGYSNIGQSVVKFLSKLHILIFSFSVDQNYPFLSIPMSFERCTLDMKVSREDAALYFLDGKVIHGATESGLPRCTHRQQGERSLKRFSLCKLTVLLLVVRAQTIVFACCITLTIETAPYQLSTTIFMPISASCTVFLHY